MFLYIFVYSILMITKCEWAMSLAHPLHHHSLQTRVPPRSLVHKHEVAMTRHQHHRLTPPPPHLLACKREPRTTNHHHLLSHANMSGRGRGPIGTTNITTHASNVSWHHRRPTTTSCRTQTRVGGNVASLAPPTPPPVPPTRAGSTIGPP